MAAGATVTDRCTQYALDVVAGVIVAGEYEREWVLIRGEKRRRFKTGGWNLYESTAIHKIL